jgi:hypothetical protein
MLALADRVESLTGPDREVDGLIERVLHPNWESDDCAFDDPPIYTASLDAAMTLGDGLTEAQIWMIWNKALGGAAMGDVRKDVARHLTAADLRALAQEAGE